MLLCLSCRRFRGSGCWLLAGGCWSVVDAVGWWGWVVGWGLLVSVYLHRWCGLWAGVLGLLGLGGGLVVFALARGGVGVGGPLVGVARNGAPVLRGLAAG